MTSQERRDSLADQAAAWVPPWARERQPAESPEPDPATESRSAEVPPAEAQSAEPRSAVVATGVVVEPETPDDPEAVSDHEAVADSEVVADPDVAAEPDDAEPDVAGGPEAVGSSGTLADPGPALSEPAGRVAADPIRPRQSAPAATLALLDEDELRGALEAILLVVDEPVAETVLAQVLEQPVDRVGAALLRIARGYLDAGHGFELRRAAGGWRLYTRPEYAGYVERFVLDGQSVRLTQAALETLAVVAYKQPVTRSRISAIRGVNCDGVIRTLISRGLVEECGTEPDSGAYLYRTTTLFLEKLGLDTVDELPPLAPFLPDDLEEMTDAPR